VSYDCFISHAGEDKKTFVEQLAYSLRHLGLKVWYDEFEMSVGDSLTRKIDQGLSEAKYGVLILSEAFISKPWPEYELRGLAAREIGSDKVILPIWYKINRDQVLKFSPPLADKIAIVTNGENLDEVVMELLRVIRPGIHDAIIRIKAYESHIASQPIKQIPISEISYKGKIRHPNLMPTQLLRLRNIRAILLEIFPQKFTDMVDNFRRDMIPEKEIFIWEGIAASVACYKELFSPSAEELHDVFSALLYASTNGVDALLKDANFPTLNIDKIYNLVEIWASVVKPVDIKRGDVD
jgi:hypothetical protein